MLNKKHVDINKLFQEKSNSSKEIEMWKTDICLLQKRLYNKENSIGVEEQIKRDEKKSCLKKTRGAYIKKNNLA